MLIGPDNQNSLTANPLVSNKSLLPDEVATNFSELAFVENELDHRKTNLGYGLGYGLRSTLGTDRDGPAPLDRFANFLAQQYQSLTQKVSDFFNGYTPLHRAIINSNHNELITGLNSDNAHLTDSRGHTYLHTAILHDNLDAVIFLLESDELDINAKDTIGHTPLHTAMLKDFRDTAMLLIAHGANVNILNAYHQAAIHVAIQSNDHELFNMILEHGGDCNLKDSHGYTPLQLAILKHNEHMVRRLLSSGAHIDSYAKNFAAKEYPNSPSIYKLIHQPIVKSHVERLAFFQADKIELLSEYKKIGEKKTGISAGGIHEDSSGVSYMVKSSWLGGIFNEFISGPLFSYYLGDNVPEIGLIFDDIKGKILIRSKMMSGFVQLNDLKSTISKANPALCDADQSQVKPDFINTTIQSKPIKGYQLMAAVLSFLSEKDAHGQNFGLIEQPDFFEAAKVDHTFTTEENLTGWFSKLFHKSSGIYLYHEIESFFKSHFGEENIMCHGYMNIKSAIDRIADTPFETIEEIVFHQAAEFKSYLYQCSAHALERLEKGEKLKDLTLMDFDVDAHVKSRLEMLKQNHQAFKELQSMLETDRLLYRHPEEASQIDTNQLIYPFHALSLGLKPPSNEQLQNSTVKEAIAQVYLENMSKSDNLTSENKNYLKLT